MNLRMWLSALLMNSMVVACILTGCTTVIDDDGDKPGPQEGKATKLALSIPSVSTYADPNATVDEVKVTTVDIFIMNGSALEKHEPLTSSDFNYISSTEKYEMKNPIEVYSGAKKIYVGVNLPTAAVNAIKTGGPQSVYSETGLALRNNISLSTGFSMFNAKDSVFTIEPDVEDPRAESKNVFAIEVSRWASKATSRKASALNSTAAGATFDIGSTGGLTFCMGNVNTKMYPLQKKLTTGVVEDPNYASNYTLYGADFVHDFGTSASIIATAYVDVDADGTGVTARKNKYTVENTSAAPFLQGLTSFLSVRAKFMPNNIVTAVDATTGAPTQTLNTTYLNDLYVYTTAVGEYLYFTSNSLATTWKDHAANTGNVYKGNYKNAYCYYFIFLEPKAAYPHGAYAALRNFYYDTRITQIAGLGYPNPEPPDPEDPIGTSTNIIVDVTIQYWTLVSTSHSLGEI
jgi:hypothetical protein